MERGLAAADADAEPALENAGGVGVDDGLVQAVGDAQYGASRVAADAGQLTYHLRIGGQAAAVLVDDDAGSPLQVAGACVVTEAVPGLADLGLPRRCQV